MKHCTNCGGQIEEGDGFCENCGHKVDIAPILPASVSPTILEKEKAEQVGERVDSSKELYFIAIALGVFFAVFLIVVLSANKPSDTLTTIPESSVPAPPTSPDFSGNISKDTSPEPSKQETITNPDYLKNPSGYYIDQGNTIKSQTPTDKPLWVEEIVDSAVLEVSYPVVKAGENIIVVEHLGIPGLSQHQFYAPIFKTAGCTEFSLECIKKASECTEKATIDFMKKYLLNKEVYLDPEEVVFGTIKGWRLQMVDIDGKNKIDVAQFIGLNGYGFHYIPSPGGFQYEGKIDYTDPKIMEKYNKKLESLPYSSYQEKTLQDEIAVARLAKRGFWGTCE